MRGKSLVIEEWSGSGPPFLHVHHEDDEAWHVLEGSLTFRFADRTVQAGAGTTVFVPAGQPHTYVVTDGEARYLIIMTPRLQRLVAALHASNGADISEIMRAHASEIVSSAPTSAG
jgi:hypothetical protein